MIRLLTWLAFAALALGQSSSGMGGIWSLNRAASQFPPDLGFSIDTSAGIDPAQAAQPDTRRGRRGSSGRTSGTPFAAQRESYEDAQKRKLITDEARNPPSRMTIIDEPSVVVITNELGQTRTLHPTAREESVDIQGIPVPVTTLRDGAKLVVVYHVEQNRDVRYTYFKTDARLTVETEFLDSGAGAFRSTLPSAVRGIFRVFGNFGHCANSGTADTTRMSARKSRFTRAILLFVGVVDLRQERVDVAFETARYRRGMRRDAARADAAAMHQRHLHQHRLLAVAEPGGCMRIEKRVVTRRAGPRRRAVGDDVDVDVGVLVGIAADVQAAGRQLPRERVLDRLALEPARRRLAAEILDEDADVLEAAEFRAGSLIEGFA